VGGGNVGTGAPDAGWFAYAPLTLIPYNADPGMDYWALGVLGLGGTSSSTEPAAYLNYYLFDKNLNFIPEGSGFKKTVNSNQGIMKEFTHSITVKEPGYLLVFLSNESNDGKRVFFDELTVTLTQPIIQVDDYYPFGLSIASLSSSRENSLINKWKFQGQELQDDFDLNWYSFKWRNHDPAIGRFFNVDPLSEKYVYNSPYAFSENRVIDGIELEGLEVVLINEEKDPVIHSGAQSIKSNDKLVTVAAHGNPKLIANSNDGDHIKSGKSVDKVLTANSEAWKNRESNEGMAVVLYSCRTGCDVKDTEGNTIDMSVAQKISASEEFKDVTIIAPDERVYFTSEEVVGTYEAEAQEKNGNYIYKTDENGNIIRDSDGNRVRKNDSRSDREGSWRVFKNGEQVGSYDGDWTPTNEPGILDYLFHKED